MPDKPSDLIQGTLDMLILKTLALEPMHGYGIALRMEQISGGGFRGHPGSLFPGFRALPPLSGDAKAQRSHGFWKPPRRGGTLCLCCEMLRAGFGLSSAKSERRRR